MLSIFLLSIIDDSALQNVLVASIGGVLTLIGKWITERYRKDRDKQESLKSILEANKAYRQELRIDLVEAKKEIKECYSLIENFKTEIVKLKKELEDCYSLHSKGSREVDD